MKIRIFAAAAVILSVFLLASCGKYSKGDKLVQQGIEQYKAGEYSAALASFAEAENEGLKTAKEEVLCYYAGEACCKLEDYEKSIKYHKRAVELKPQTFKSWVTIGVCYRKLGNDSEALKAYTQALKYDPENADSVGLYVSLGALYISSDKPYTAINYLEKAAKIYPEHPAAHAYLAIAYAMAYKYAEADDQLALAVACGYGNVKDIEERIAEVKKAHADIPAFK